MEDMRFEQELPGLLQLPPKIPGTHLCHRSDDPEKFRVQIWWEVPSPKLLSHQWQGWWFVNFFSISMHITYTYNNIPYYY